MNAVPHYHEWCNRLGEITSFSMPGMKMCCTLGKKKLHFWSLMSLLVCFACFGYCCCYCPGCMSKIPQVLQNISPSGQLMYFLFLSQNFYLWVHLWSTNVFPPAVVSLFFSLTFLFYFFFSHLIPYIYMYAYIVKKVYIKKTKRLFNLRNWFI